MNIIPGTCRIPALFEKLFPQVTWGDQDKNSTKIYFTFDDGPIKNQTLPILECLDSFKIPATFFLRGSRMKSEIKTIEEIQKNHFQTGYHGRSHKTWWFRSSSFRNKEMNPELLSEPLSMLFKDRPLLLRPPYGRIDPFVITTAKKLDAVIIQYRLVVGDWLKGKTARQISDDILNYTHNGDIIVLHDGGINGHLLPDVLKDVIPNLADRGFSFGSISDLLKDNV